MRKKPLLYGWRDEATFRVSRYPPDSPVRPSIAFESEDDVKEFIERKRAEILWWPPLR